MAKQMVDESVKSAAQSSTATSGLEALLRASGEDGASSGLRPVETWNPPYCGDIGMSISRDGVWRYQGSPLGRIALIKLFASILRKDADEKTYLVTPAEKVDVQVEDAPFLAVEMAVDGDGEQQRLTFRTNVDDVVTVSAEHPLRFERQPPDGGLKPYVRVRGRLEALCTRAVYAELVAIATPDGAGELGLWSGGAWFALEA